MAKKKTGISKTQMILNALAKNPDASPTDIARSLSAYNVSPAYVSNIKSTHKAGKTGGKKRGRKKAGKKARRGRPRGSTSRAGSGGLSVAELLKAKQLSDQLGGVERAQILLDALSKLQG